jgi:hypothetical protein
VAALTVAAGRGSGESARISHPPLSAGSATTNSVPRAPAASRTPGPDFPNRSPRRPVPRAAQRWTSPGGRRYSPHWSDLERPAVGRDGPGSKEATLNGHRPYVIMEFSTLRDHKGQLCPRCHLPCWNLPGASSPPCRPSARHPTPRPGSSPGMPSAPDSVNVNLDRGHDNRKSRALLGESGFTGEIARKGAPRFRPASAGRRSGRIPG